MTGTGIYGGVEVMGAGRDITYSPDTKCSVVNTALSENIGTATMTADLGGGLSFGKHVK